MGFDDILELVKDGTLDPGQIEDFENLDPEIQQLVTDGDLDTDNTPDI